MKFVPLSTTCETQSETGTAGTVTGLGTQTQGDYNMNETLAELLKELVKTQAELEGIKARLGVVRYLCETEKLIYTKEIYNLFDWDLDKPEEQEAAND